MNEGIPDFNEKIERTKALEEITHYKIWTDRLLEELERLANGIDSVNEPKDLYVDNKIGFGYEQYSRILIDGFDGMVGKMSMDMEESIKKINPEFVIVGNLYENIPYELINKIENFKKTQNKADLPSKEEVTTAHNKVRGLVNILNKVDTTK